MTYPKTAAEFYNSLIVMPTLKERRALISMWVADGLVLDDTNLKDGANSVSSLYVMCAKGESFYKLAWWAIDKYRLDPLRPIATGVNIVKDFLSLSLYCVGTDSVLSNWVDRGYPLIKPFPNINSTFIGSHERFAFKILKDESKYGCAKELAMRHEYLEETDSGKKHSSGPTWFHLLKLSKSEKDIKLMMNAGDGIIDVSNDKVFLDPANFEIDNSNATFKDWFQSYLASVPIRNHRWQEVVWKHVFSKLSLDEKNCFFCDVFKNDNTWMSVSDTGFKLLLELVEKNIKKAIEDIANGGSKKFTFGFEHIFNDDNQMRSKSKFALEQMIRLYKVAKEAGLKTTIKDDDLALGVLCKQADGFFGLTKNLKFSMTEVICSLCILEKQKRLSSFRFKNVRSQIKVSKNIVNKMIVERLSLPLTSNEWDASFGGLNFNSVLKFKYVLIEMARKNFVSPSIMLKFLNQPEFAVNKELSSSLHIQMAYLKKEMDDLVNEIERIGLIQSSVSGLSASKLNNKSTL